MSTARPKIPIAQLQTRATPAASSSNLGPGSPFFKRRAFLYAGGFAVITIAGTLIGASLKTQMQEREKEEATKRTREKNGKAFPVDVEGQIALLEETKSGLVQRRRQIQQKIEEVRERVVKEEELRVQREALRREGDEIKRQMTIRRSAERG